MTIYQKLITFDITGTLLKTKRPMAEMYADAGRSFGLTKIDPVKISNNFKSEWDNLCKKHPNFGLYSGLGWESWWKCIVRSTFQNSNVEYSTDKSLDKLCIYLIDLFSSKNGWRCEEGAQDLLKYLHSNKVHLGVISNFDVRLYNILKELELNDYFSFVLTSYETTYLKPDVNIFKLAEKRYEILSGLPFDKERALHVGDSFENDVVGANNAGWKGALISPTIFGENKSSLIFKNLPDLKKYLQPESR